MTGQIIKDKRMKLGLLRHELADALGLGRGGKLIVRDWEDGKSTPSTAQLEKLNRLGSEIPFPNADSEDAQFTFIDLFSGIGGMRIPFSSMGGRCVFSSEWDKFAGKTYRLNFGDTPQGDIREIEAQSIPDFDVLLAGFPCQPFSQAGLKKGFKDTRGTLFFEIERIIREKRPAAFLLENVKQLIGHDKGNTLNVIMSNLENLNYHVEYAVLRAADFGLPQHRPRVYIVGYDNERLPDGERYDFNFPVPENVAVRLGSILEKSVSDKYYISDRLLEGHIRRKRLNKANGKGFGYTVFTSESKYTNTLSARYYKDGSEIMIEDDPHKNPRKLTPRECARLQGFPEKFVIPVSDTQAYKQFGNSVAVPVIQRLAEMIIGELHNKRII
jgi:DNA (cytosine-5)-methyltransferase 1